MPSCCGNKDKDKTIEEKKRFNEKKLNLFKRNSKDELPFFDNIKIPVTFLILEDLNGKDEILPTFEDIKNIKNQLDICNLLGFSKPNTKRIHYGESIEDKYGKNNISKQNIYSDTIANYNYQFLLPLYRNEENKKIDYENLENWDIFKKNPIRKIDINKNKGFLSSSENEISKAVDKIKDGYFSHNNNFTIVIIPKESNMMGEEGVLGFALTNRNTVLIKDEFFGMKKNEDEEHISLGKTIIHELGHLLDLPHTFDEGVLPVEFLQIIKDTPCIRDTFTNKLGSNKATDPLSNTNTKRPLDVHKKENHQIENFMDYSDDIFFMLFTKGQKIVSDELFEKNGRLFNVGQEGIRQFSSTWPNMPSDNVLNKSKIKNNKDLKKIIYDIDYLELKFKETYKYLFNNKYQNVIGYINGDEWAEKEWEYHNEEWDIEREIGTFPKKPDSNYLKKFPNDPKVPVMNLIDRFGFTIIFFLIGNWFQKIFGGKKKNLGNDLSLISYLLIKKKFINFLKK